jgi:hypothetical protein
LPDNALKSIFTKNLPFKSDLTYQQLRLEYIDFISKWDKLNINCKNVYNSQNRSFEDSENESDNSTNMYLSILSLNNY